MRQPWKERCRSSPQSCFSCSDHVVLQYVFSFKTDLFKLSVSVWGSSGRTPDLSLSCSNSVSFSLRSHQPLIYNLQSLSCFMAAHNQTVQYRKSVMAEWKIDDQTALNAKLHNRFFNIKPSVRSMWRDWCFSSAGRHSKS